MQLNDADIISPFKDPEVRLEHASCRSRSGKQAKPTILFWSKLVYCMWKK